MTSKRYTLGYVEGSLRGAIESFVLDYSLYWGMGSVVAFAVNLMKTGSITSALVTAVEFIIIMFIVFVSLVVMVHMAEYFRGSKEVGND